MTKIAGGLTGGLSMVVFVVGASTMVAAPQTAKPIQPGEMTQAHVWVENRGANQAIPIDLREANINVPLNVHVTNGEPGAVMTAPLAVRGTRQNWEYEMVTLASDGRDASLLLNAQGVAGWETTGIAFVSGDGTMLLLKRPR
jgi:hypothetical protein